MLTRSGHGESLSRKAEDRFVRRIFTSNNRLSLRLCDAPIGAAALASIISGVLMIPVAESFGGLRTAAGRALSIVILLFAPAILGAIYSLAFEKSKVYGSLDLALAGIALRVLPFTWYWLSRFLPFACAFTAFCAVVRWFERRRKR